MIHWTKWSLHNSTAHSKAVKIKKCRITVYKRFLNSFHKLCHHVVRQLVDSHHHLHLQHVCRLGMLKSLQDACWPSGDILNFLDVPLLVTASYTHLVSVQHSKSLHGGQMTIIAWVKGIIVLTTFASSGVCGSSSREFKLSQCMA